MKAGLFFANTVMIVYERVGIHGIAFRTSATRLGNTASSDGDGGGGGGGRDGHGD